jgi:hypothetical protein
MSASRDTKNVQDHMLDVAAGRPTGRQELVLNPSTGQLVVSNQPSQDAITVDSINRDGFFGQLRAAI